MYAPGMIGSEIGHYRISGLLGEGGMGVVYRARDLNLGREVALKVLPPGSGQDAEARARLVREARTASALNHPNICHIYEVGEERGGTWIAMELVEGRSLRELIPREGLPAGTAVRYGAHIAGALAHAHERGVIHRDLKAANVVVTPAGLAKVLDFGLAKRLHPELLEDSSDSLALTRTGMVVGTPNYLAPEILRGRPADERSEVWTLGILLYEMASGDAPFRGTSLIEISAAILEKSPRPLPSSVPAGLAAVIRRCLEKDPDDRYQRALEVQAALEALSSDPGCACVADTTARRSGTRRYRAAAIAGIVLLGLLAWLGRDRVTGLLGRGPASSGPAISALAVLPLVNLSGDPQQEFFADGMTEELITSLASIPSLKVISRTSSMQYKGTRKPLPQIGRELGVDGILEGSITRAGDRVRISAQLIEARTDRHLWARSYERDMSEVLAIQNAVARDIAGEIRMKLTPEMDARLAGKRAVNPEAYELYLKGRFHQAKVTDEGCRMAIQLFEQSIALDPGDPRPYTGIADACLLMAQLLESMPYSEAMPRVRENAGKALALDEHSAEAHTSMGLALLFADREWDQAERHLRRAVQLNPSYGLAHLGLALHFEFRGDLSGALAEVRLARDLDPLSLLINWSYAQDLKNAGRFEEALEVARKTLEIDPNSMLPQSLFADIYETIGNYDAAIATYEKWLPEEDGGKAYVAALRRAYRAGGERGYWQTALERARTSPESDGRCSCLVAICHARLGDWEEALGALSRSAEQGSTDLLFMRIVPAFAPLRADPRFEAIARRAGLPPL